MVNINNALFNHTLIKPHAQSMKNELLRKKLQVLAGKEPRRVYLALTTLISFKAVGHLAG